MDAPEQEEGRTVDISGTIIAETRPRPEQQIVAEQAVIQIEVVGGPMDGTRCRVAQSSCIIGRSNTNDLTLHFDPLVSSSHARIVREDQRYWLEDLDSRNGTYIGDERIRKRTPIGPGTIFAVGHTNLEFMPG